VITDKLSNIPQSSGCYLFKNKKGQIIYVGKSKYLPKRVKSYFQKNHKDQKTLSLVKEITDVEFMTTNDESQALLLEDELIKSHKPKYNIKAKDDRSRRWFITLSSDEFPRLLVCNPTTLSGEILLESTSSNSCYEIYEMVHDIFNLRSCSYNLTEENIQNEKFKTCLEFHLGRCNAPCVSLIQKFSYLKIVNEMKDIFSFQFDSVRNRLNRSMKYHSTQMEFEIAQVFKNKIDVVDKLEKKLEPFRVRKYNDVARSFKEEFGLLNIPTLIEAYDNSHTAGDCQVSALIRYKNGKTDKSNYRKFNIKTVEGPDDYASFDEVLNRRFKRLLNEKKELPSLVIIDGGKGQLGVAKKVFEELGLLNRVDLISISKDDKHRSSTIHKIDGSSFDIPRSEFGFLLAEIQNEVHRFVITFHRKKRSKSIIG
jgi:excinuclease ABC subunit C